MDPHTLGLILIALAIMASAIFTIAPVVPGTAFIFVGAAAYGLADSFEPFAWWFWLLQTLLAISYLITDNVVQAVGVKKGGGSRESIIGGTIGVIAGPFVLAPISGPLAILLGPPIGAVVGTVAGELLARRRDEASSTLSESTATDDVSPRSSYRRLSGWALVSFFAGTAVKFAVVGAQAILLVFVAW